MIERRDLIDVLTYAVIGKHDTLATMLQRKHSVLPTRHQLRVLLQSKSVRLPTSTQLIPLITIGFPTAIFCIQATSSQLRLGSTYANWAALVDADPDSRLASLGGCSPGIITSPHQRHHREKRRVALYLPDLEQSFPSCLVHVYLPIHHPLLSAHLVEKERRAQLTTGASTVSQMDCIPRSNAFLSVFSARALTALDKLIPTK
jgi:hypothetical protein